MYAKFVYHDDDNGYRHCGRNLFKFFSQWCHDYKIRLEKTIGTENVLKMNFNSLNNKNREYDNEDRKYLYGKLTEFCCTHRCNETTLEKLCIPRLNIF
uniref:IlGF domain-containing protein n=1 Tax=Strongyloides venezuelensis TaxID=75913 RepID=A0A0K0G4L0_STRVS